MIENVPFVGNRFVLGIACHLRHFHMYGDDDVSNGLALDQGALTLSDNYQILISEQINGVKTDDYLYAFEGKEIFRPRESEYCLNKMNLKWYREYIFVK